MKSSVISIIIGSQSDLKTIKEAIGHTYRWSLSMLREIN